MGFSLVVGLLCALPSLSFAQWNPAVRTQVEALNAKYRFLDTSGLGTFWGGLMRWRHLSKNQGHVTPWPSSLFKSGHVPVYFSQRPHPAPLAVFMPGIFGEVDKGFSTQTIDMLEELGFHVLAVPNLMAASYITAGPLYQTDVVQAEVRVMEEALDRALAELGPRAGKVHVVAESLGTAIAAAWAGHDAANHRRLHALNLFWPPQNLRRAMHNFDLAINEHRPWADHCGQLRMYARLVTDFLWKDVPTSLTPEEKWCFGAHGVVKGFLKAVGHTYGAYQRSRGIASEWRPDGFESLFRHYRPELWKLLERDDPRLDLAYWMTRARANPGLAVRVMSGEDDFLNRGMPWGEFLKRSGLSADQLIVLPWGGHSGPMGMPEFKGLLKAALES